MKQTYQYAWIMHFLPVPVLMLIGIKLVLFPTTKYFRRIWASTSILLSIIVMFFQLIYLFS